MESDGPAPAPQRRLACDYMCQVWAWAAQRNFGFDDATARRLAFVRWLRATGRLGDQLGAGPNGGAPLAAPGKESEQ